MRLWVLQIMQGFSQHARKLAAGNTMGLQQPQLGIAVSASIVLSFEERLKSTFGFGRWLVHGYVAA